jgi:hypothetical protein
MSGASLVLMCALDLLGRSPESLPPIKLVERPIAGASLTVEAYVLSDSPVIYIVTSTPAFRDARCEDRSSLVKLASIIAHEEWHVRRGTDERGAYEAQLMTLMTLGAGPETWVYNSVRRAMRHVLATKSKAAAEQSPKSDGAAAAIPLQLSAGD